MVVAWSRTLTLNAKYKNRFEGWALANSTKVVVLPEPANAATLTTSFGFKRHRTMANCSSVNGGAAVGLLDVLVWVVVVEVVVEEEVVAKEVVAEEEDIDVEGRW